MDKMKIYVDYLKKYHFWVMLGVVFIAAILVYQVQTAELLEATETKKSLLDSMVDEQQNLVREFAPNETVITTVGDINGKMEVDIVQGWSRLYQEQRVKLLWPVKLGNFATELNLLGPDARLDERLLRAYQDEMRDGHERARLMEKIQLYREMDKSGGNDPRNPGRRGGGEVDPDKIERKGILRWSRFNDIFAFPWLNAQQPPTEDQVHTAQENLWVYESLLDQLIKLNAEPQPGDVKPAEPQPGEAKPGPTQSGPRLKEIVDFRLAQSANNLPPTTTILSELGSMREVAAVMQNTNNNNQLGGLGHIGGGPPPGAFGGPPKPGAIGVGGENLGPTGDGGPFDRRYCDANGKPLRSSELAAVREDPYRLLPVRLLLIVKQKSIPEIVANLSGAVTPMRVRQIQVFQPGQTPSSLIGPDAPQQVAASGPGARPVKAEDQWVFPPLTTFEQGDMKVELRGYVYLYQKPNPAKLPKFKAAGGDLAKLPGYNASTPAPPKAGVQGAQQAPPAGARGTGSTTALPATNETRGTNTARLPSATPGTD